ncbi:MAG: flavin reductase family protein [Bacteroidia bacterium]|nr:flavin reductase family protein [Bacteroidia bacterium]
MTLFPESLPQPQLHQYLLGIVAPRPIAFVSTLAPDGTPNLAPYSFFNCFSSNPPIVVFSSNRRARNRSVKDTLSNIEATGEAVINAVSYDIAWQMSLAGVEYPPEVSEFEKAGLTPLASERVKPFRVAESPAQLECRVQQIIPLGDGGGAGNLILCEVVAIHIAERVLDAESRIDPHKIDLMARMGRAFYCRASGGAVFPIPQDQQAMSIGFDGLPPQIRHSAVLTGNDLAQLASALEVPARDGSALADPEVVQALAEGAEAGVLRLHGYAQALIRAGELGRAWQVLLSGE